MTKRDFPLQGATVTEEIIDELHSELPNKQRSPDNPLEDGSYIAFVVWNGSEWSIKDRCKMTYEEQGTDHYDNNKDTLKINMGGGDSKERIEKGFKMSLNTQKEIQKR